MFGAKALRRELVIKELLGSELILQLTLLPTTGHLVSLVRFFLNTSFAKPSKIFSTWFKRQRHDKAFQNNKDLLTECEDRLYRKVLPEVFRTDRATKERIKTHSGSVIRRHCTAKKL